MEYAPILPAGLSPQMLDTLAAQGLRELSHAPIAKVARALARFDRVQLGIAIEIMVAMLDVADGEPDAEDDDPSGQCDEDGINTNLYEQWGRGPGCTISDDDVEHDGREYERGY